MLNLHAVNGSVLRRSLPATAFAIFASLAMVHGASAEQTLRIAFSEPNTNFDPIVTTENTDIRLLLEMNSYLLRLSDDGTKYVPDLASRWDVSADGKEYTFHLTDAKFSDGSPVTPDDVKFSIERVRDSKASAQASLYSLIKDVQIVDQKTVRVILTTPSPATLAALAMYSAAILPKAIVTKDEEKFSEMPVGAGPFALSEWIRGDRAVLKKNPYYRDAAKIAIDKVEWIAVQDDNARMLQVQGGQIDATLPVPMNLVSSLKASGTTQVVISPSTFTDALIFNYQTKLLQDHRVREAIALALDMDTINKIITFGIGTRSNSVLAKGTLYYDKDIPLRPYDPKRAKELLEEAGAVGQTVEVIIPVGNSYLDQFCVVAQQQLAAVGLTLQIRRLDKAQFNSDSEQGNYQMAVGNWSNDMAHPDQKMSFVLGGGESNNYYSRYDNPKLAEEVKVARTIVDDGEAFAAYSKIQREAYDDVFWVDLFQLPYVAAVAPNVEGFRQDITGRVPFEDIKIK